MRFDFAAPGRILFGAGTVREAPAAVRALGRRALLVTGIPVTTLDIPAAATIAVTREPTLDLVRQGAQVARAAGCDVVVSLGGGSAIDAGKAIAALAASGGDPLDYLEVVGRSQPIPAALPLVAIPTTAGTGAEATRNAVLGSPEHGVKASLRSPLLLARLALVDPELTYALPPAITASTGLDALTQLIEPYVSVRANAMTDMFCEEGMRRVAGSLVCAWRHGGDAEARADMSLASLLGGLSLANAGLGAVHGFAAPLGGQFNAPHGALCAAVLPHAMRVNIHAARQRAASEETLRRFAAVARILTGHPSATPEDAAEWIAALCAELGIPPLGAYGVRAADIPTLVEKAAQSSSMRANPVSLTSEELTAILAAAL